MARWLRGAAIVAVLVFANAAQSQTTCDRLDADPSDQCLATLSQTLRQVPPRAPALDARPPAPPTATTPIYDPELLSELEVDGPMKLWNNCYAYAVGATSITTAPPRYRDPVWGQVRTPGMLGGYAELTDDGRGGLQMMRPEEITCDNVATRAQADGLDAAGAGDSCAGGWKVALFVHEANDFHWMRQNHDGTWSGKMGQLGLHTTDGDNQVIRNPGRANMGNYSFCGYMCRGQRFQNNLSRYQQRRGGG